MIEFRRDESDSLKISAFCLYNTIEMVTPNSKTQSSSKFYQFNILEMWEPTQFPGLTVELRNVRTHTFREFFLILFSIL